MEPRVTTVRPLPGYRLALTFDDGTSGVVNCTQWVERLPTGLFAELRDPAEFARVYVEPEFGVIEWPNGADVDPYVLYEEAHRPVVR